MDPPYGWAIWSPPHVRVTPAFREKHGFGVIILIVTASPEKHTTYEVKFIKSLKTFRFSFDAGGIMGKIDKIKEGDLVVAGRTKALHCAGDPKIP